MKRQTITRYVQLIYRFLLRDLYVHAGSTKDFVINYVILWPATYAFCFAYLQTNVLFGPNAVQKGTTLFIGNIVLIMLASTFKYTLPFLQDLEGDRFIDYQITLLPPRLVLLERIIFATIFGFFISLPFYPGAKLLLQNHLDTSNTDWMRVIILLFCGSLCCSAYNLCALIMMGSTQKLGSFWSRINNVLMTFGGFWIPWHVTYAFCAPLGLGILFTPLIYLSEGLRGAIVGGDQFISFGYCVAALLGFSVVFTYGSWYFFKKHVDHI